MITTVRFKGSSVVANFFPQPSGGADAYNTGRRRFYCARLSRFEEEINTTFVPIHSSVAVPQSTVFADILLQFIKQIVKPTKAGYL